LKIFFIGTPFHQTRCKAFKLLHEFIPESIPVLGIMRWRDYIAIGGNQTKTARRDSRAASFLVRSDAVQLARLRILP
jgi:hypothetical protein